MVAAAAGRRMPGDRRRAPCGTVRAMDPRPIDPAPADDPEDPFEAWVIEAIEALPPAFRERLGSVAITIADEANADQLASVRARGLYGLYQGVPRSAWGADNSPVPSKITIFRGPLTRAHRDPRAQRQAVVDTVHHEIAHHFGIGDDRLRELESDRRTRR